jgi:hypothetical protein
MHSVCYDSHRLSGSRNGPGRGNARKGVQRGLGPSISPMLLTRNMHAMISPAVAARTAAVGREGRGQWNTGGQKPRSRPSIFDRGSREGCKTGIDQGPKRASFGSLKLDEIAASY